MREKRVVQPGGVYGRWTAVSPSEPSEKGESKWLCLCACGTERKVLSRALLYGLSTSCGCLTRERAAQKNAMDLSGEVFGDLYVMGRAPRTGKNGGARWQCRCICGKECVVLGTLLAGGKRTHCGCKTQRSYAYTNIAGQKFNRLTAMYRLEEADANGSILWHCRCDCGEEVDVSYNALAYSNVQSCGCKKREHDKELSSLLTHVDGTSLDMLKSKKIPKNNTTGVRGVYLIKGKYVAKIVFQKKQYFLGRYDDLESAKRARREAEEIIGEQVVAYYERWKMLASEDPIWAEENPVRLIVDQTESGKLRITALPLLEETAQKMIC